MVVMPRLSLQSYHSILHHIIYINTVYYKDHIKKKHLTHTLEVLQNSDGAHFDLLLRLNN